jgi:hypothetical protein
VRTTIETPAGPFVYYERQQKLHITLKHQHQHKHQPQQQHEKQEMEYAVTGDITLEWLRKWIERKAECHCDIVFFSGETKISESEEGMIAFKVSNLNVRVKEQKRVEWMPSDNDFECEMNLWTDSVKGIIENPFND